VEKEELLSLIGHDRHHRWSRHGTNGIEAIIHLGACSSTTERDASYLIRNNFEYTKQLALFAVENGIRFLYASSAATYGDGANGFCDDHRKLIELHPLTMYGYSKQLFDAWARDKGLLKEIVGLKFFNIFGPNEYHKGDMRSLVAKACEEVRSTGKLCLFKSHRSDYGDGEQQRDFLYVMDAIEIVLHFLDSRHINGIYNIGSGRADTWNELAAAVFKSLGKPERIEYIEMPETIREKYQYYTCADITKLRLAGYERPFKTLDEAVEDYVVNYLVPQPRLGEK
jgi:ADP-L-glycero-D-manno-heptose 6-epimerase